MKLQPNFSWQKYEGKEEDQKSQFQFQLQQQHIQVANSVNATIDDCSFFDRERPTGFTWVDGKQIYSKSIKVVWDPLSGGTSSTNPLGITGNFTIVKMSCCISNGTLSSSNTLMLPHIDPGVPVNEVAIVRVGTNVVLGAGVDRSAYTGYITVYYTKS